MQIATLYPRALATPAATAAHGESASDFDRFLTASSQSEAAASEPARNRQENDKATDGATDGATAASPGDLHALPDGVCPVAPAPTPLQTSQDLPASSSLSYGCARSQPVAGPGLAAEATSIPTEISVTPSDQVGADLSVDQPPHLVAAGSPQGRVLHGFDAMTEAADSAAKDAAPSRGVGKEGWATPQVAIATGRGSDLAILSTADGQIGLRLVEPGKGAAQNAPAQPAPAQPIPANVHPTTAQAGQAFAGQSALTAVTLTMRPASSASAQSPPSAMVEGAAPPADQPRTVIMLPSDQDADLGAGGRGGAQRLHMGTDLLILPPDVNDASALGPTAGLPPSMPTPGSGLTSPTGPLPAQTPIQQVSQMVVHVAQNGPDGPIDIALHPEELGQIRFELTTSGNRLHITLFVERPESLDLFRRHISDLMTDIRQSGFGQTSLSFGNWSKRDHQPAPPPPLAQAALHPAQARQGWAEADRSPAQTHDTGRLDLRL